MHLVLQKEITMKTKLITIAGGLACVVLTTAMPIYAEEIHNAVSGSTLSLGDADGAPLGNVNHSTSKPLKQNGKKFNKEGSTGVTNSQISLVGSDPVCPGGVLYDYEYAYGVSTAANGDLLVFALDPQPDPNDLTKESKLCVFGGFYQATLYQTITGGTGEYEGACGWLETNVEGAFLGVNTTMTAYVGEQVGEILVGDDCPL